MAISLKPKFRRNRVATTSALALPQTVPMRKPASQLTIEQWVGLMESGRAYIDDATGVGVVEPIGMNLAAGPGTTYVANGSVKPPPASTTELGSSRGGIIPDRVPQFTSKSQAIRQYEFMTNDDVAVDLSLRAAKMPILAADFYIEAAGDTPMDIMAQQFVQDNIFNGLQCSWIALLEDILRFYEYGVTAFETVYENRVWAPNSTGANRKNYTMLKDIAARPTPTLGQFFYDDNGRLLSIDHSATKGDNTTTNVNITRNSLLLFTFNRKAGNLEGKSILRTAYKHWYFKNQFYLIDGIQKERHGTGFPVLMLPQGYDDNDKKAGLELVRNIRTNEEAGAVLPPLFELSFVSFGGQPVDVMASIDHHNGMIMLNVMIAFLVAGVSSTSGLSRGSSASSQDVYTKSLRYIGNLICEIFNISLIPQLVAYNFPVSRFPQMGVRNIGETKDMQQWSSGIANLVTSNLITPDYETEQFVRMIADFPLKKGGVQTPIQTNTTGFSNTKGTAQPGNGKGGNVPKGTNPPQPPL